MKIYAVLTFLAISAPAGATELCRGRENNIEPDMRVQEADLTKAAALEATKRLSDRIRRDALEGDEHFGVLNAQKVIRGYLLKRQAERYAAKHGASHPTAAEFRDSFCAWLSSEGFWHD